MLGHAAAAFRMRGADVVAKGEVAIAQSDKYGCHAACSAFAHLEAFAVTRGEPGNGGQDFQHFPETLFVDFGGRGFETGFETVPRVVEGKNDEVRAVIRHERGQARVRVMGRRDGIDDAIGSRAVNGVVGIGRCAEDGNDCHQGLREMVDEWMIRVWPETQVWLL